MKFVFDFIVAAFTTDIRLTIFSAAGTAFCYFAAKGCIRDMLRDKEEMEATVLELIRYRRRANEVSFGVPCDCIHAYWPPESNPPEGADPIHCHAFAIARMVFWRVSRHLNPEEKEAVFRTFYTTARAELEWFNEQRKEVDREEPKPVA
jgi:hypothetical protein